MGAFFLYLHFLIVAIFTIRILVREDMAPTSRMAWFVVITLIPYAGELAYLLFGEADPGKKAAIRHQDITFQITEGGRAQRGTPENVTQLIDPLYQPGFAYAASVNGFYPLDGNKAELMPDSGATRTRLIADIDAAEKDVNVLYYIWLEDDTGTAIAEALMRASKRGVKCRAMADGLGSRNMVKSDLWKAMQDAGVELAVALPIDRPIHTIFTSRLDLRNHRKITVIDSKVTYCGSRNSADPEFRVKAKFAPWVDIMLRLEGPVVAQNLLLFASDWMQATGQGLDQFSLETPSFEDGFPALIMGDGPTERRGATPQMFSTLMATARDTLTISTPYFVPDDTVLMALRAAANRGVKVELILPHRNDSWIVSAASKSYYRGLLEAGVEIHEYLDGLLHAKTLTIDGKVSLIGSSNIDLRSFDLNYENNILLQDDAITRDITDRQQHYISRSKPIRFHEIDNWSFPQRIWQNVIATIGPVL